MSSSWGRPGRAASLNDGVTAEMVDLRHYPELKKKYKIMSVPCMVIDGETVYFGKKSKEEVRILEAHSPEAHSPMAEKAGNNEIK